MRAHRRVLTARFQRQFAYAANKALSTGRTNMKTLNRVMYIHTIVFILAAFVSVFAGLAQAQSQADNGFWARADRLGEQVRGMTGWFEDERSVTFKIIQLHYEQKPADILSLEIMIEFQAAHQETLAPRHAYLQCGASKDEPSESQGLLSFDDQAVFVRDAAGQLQRRSVASIDLEPNKKVAVLFRFTSQGVNEIQDVERCYLDVAIRMEKINGVEVGRVEFEPADCSVQSRAPSLSCNGIEPEKSDFFFRAQEVWLSENLQWSRKLGVEHEVNSACIGLERCEYPFTIGAAEAVAVKGYCVNELAPISRIRVFSRLSAGPRNLNFDCSQTPD